MLKVRLQRVGRRNDPSFRVVVVDSHKGPQSGQYLEMLGSYNPRQKKVSLNAERITHWISNGAQVSDTVHNILVRENVIKGKKVNVLPKKTPIVKESTEEAASAEASAETTAEPSAEASVELAEEAPAAEAASAAEEAAPAEAPAEETPAEEPTPTEEPAADEETKTEE